MSMTPEQIAALAAQAAKTADHTETTTGGDWQPPVEGTTALRFVEYIELGKQPQKPFQGKAKPDCEEVRLTFELLLNNKNRQDVREVEVEGGGKKLVADRISMKLAVKHGEKAVFKKLFDKMRRGRDNITHMSQMIGEAFLGTVVHSKSTDGKTTYANLRDADGVWTIRAPRIQKDPLDDDSWVDVNVRAPVGDLKIFVWDFPNKECWDSLFIDGTRTVKDDKGVETEQSKNWLQERILSAKNYHGSPLEELLNKIGGLSLDPETGDAGVLDGLPEEGGEAFTGATADDLAEMGL